MTAPLTPGTLGSITDLIEYGDSAIVSRVLMKTDGGNITLFAFDSGEELSEHTTRYDAMALILDGTATWEVGGSEHSASSGEVVFLPADVPHAVKAYSRFKMLLLMLK